MFIKFGKTDTKIDSIIHQLWQWQIFIVLYNHFPPKNVSTLINTILSFGGSKKNEFLLIYN
jgi:hypothetical protein